MKKNDLNRPWAWWMKNNDLNGPWAWWMKNNDINWPWAWWMKSNEVNWPWAWWMKNKDVNWPWAWWMKNSNLIKNLIYKSNMCVRPSVCGDKNKTRSWNERGSQNLRGPEPRWPKQRRAGRGGQGRHPFFFFFFSVLTKTIFFSFSYCPSRLRGRMKCPSGLMTGRL
jgi:hypothetical protein